MAKTMVRKQVYIEQSQNELLKRVATRRGVTEAELVREALDKLISEPEQRREEARARLQKRLRAHAAATAGAPQKPREWTREWIYEERMRRYDRHPG